MTTATREIQVCHRPSQQYESSSLKRMGAWLQRKCSCGGTPGLDGQCEECRKKELGVQRSAASDLGPMFAPPIVHEVLNSPGQPLDTETRAFMEPRFGHHISQIPVNRVVVPQAKLTVNEPGDAYEQAADQVAEAVMQTKEAPRGARHDFSRVRIHSDARAAESARAVGALAYTVGSDIVFDSGQHAPQTVRGRRLLAHELTHVVQQVTEVTDRGAANVLQRETRGAGGCASTDVIDEDYNGPKAAGRIAHTQIQSFLLPRILNEVMIPRGTKTAKDDLACQAEGTREGFADLYRRDALAHEIGEIKPVGFALSHGVVEAEHYARRAEQSIDRFFGSGTVCPGSVAGADDTDFARRVGINRLHPSFRKINGILMTPTVIGTFDGDNSRTLKAQLRAPGAIGYWCTGGTTDTFTCGVSAEEMGRYVDSVAFSPAQAVLDRFLEDTIERRLTQALEQHSLGEILEIGERNFGQSIRDNLRPYLGPFADQIFNRATAREIGQLIEEDVGPEARVIVNTIIRRMISRIVAELRAQLRSMMINLVREALLALCVGAPAVTIVELMDRLRDSLRNATRALIPVVVALAAAELARETTAAMLAEMAAAIGRALGALGEVLATVGEMLLRALAAILVALLVVGVVILIVLAVVAIFDPIPGDEAALAAAAAVLARLIPTVGQFVTQGSH